MSDFFYFEYLGKLMDFHRSKGLVEANWPAGAEPFLKESKNVREEGSQSICVRERHANGEGERVFTLKS